MKLSYPAVFYPWDDGNGFTVEVPDLPGCVSECESLAEAILMGTEDAAGWLLTWMGKRRKLPAPSRRADAIKSDESVRGFLVSVRFVPRIKEA
jgi:predicted RNase H-like HicB family nuclease